MIELQGIVADYIGFGLLLALVVYFRKKIFRALEGVIRERNFWPVVNLLIISIPIGVVWFILADFMEKNEFFESILVLGVALGVVGVLMIAADFLPHFRKIDKISEITPVRALVYGFLQAFSVIPGVFRSGVTLVAGRIIGLNSFLAAELSFLTAIPVFCGVCVHSFLSEANRAFLGQNLGILVLSNVAAFGIGLLLIFLLRKYMKKEGSLQSFGYLRVGVACAILAGILLLQ